MFEIEYQAVRELYDQGYGRNAICRELHMTKHAVGKACEVLGIDWANSVPTVAVRIRSRRAANERADMARAFRALALKELKLALDDGTPSDEVRTHVTTAAIATQRELELATHVAEHEEHAERTPEQMQEDKQDAELEAEILPNLMLG
ncbi:hypothetical protein [Corynebacterium flavescens]|uniref:hypothetical protein n=1 Tax=Corynebacterium flavescens TaxID=28028 RepID=UPI00289A800D|nr:hypothetical protein [Corynebacterium flavescens]